MGSTAWKVLATHFLLFAVASAYTLSSIEPALADVPPFSLQAFVQVALPAFSKSPTATSLKKTIDSNQLSYESAMEQSPYSNHTDLSYSVFQQDQSPTDLLLFGRRTNSWSLSQELDYKLRSGFTAQLVGSYNFDSYQQPFFYDTLDRPYQVTLKFSYDVIQGGADSLDNSNAHANASQAKQAFYSTYDGLISARVQYMSLLTDIFVTECKISQLNQAKSTVAKTVQIGKLQAKTKTISHKDYLNFIDLENSFAQQTANFELNREKLYDQLIAWGDEALSASKKLQQKNLDCAPSISSLFQEISQAKLPQEELETIAHDVPSARSAASAHSASQYQLRAAHLTNLPSLSPYVAGGYNELTHSTSPYSQGTIGITLQWTPPLMKGANAESAAKLKADAAEDQERKTVLDNSARLNSLQTQILSQKNIITVLDQSLQNSRELLRTLEAYLSIGQIDSLNYANAYINSISTSNAVLDSWGTLEKSIFELSELRQWKKK